MSSWYHTASHLGGVPPAAAGTTCHNVTLSLLSPQTLRNKRREADKAANEAEQERVALEDFAAEADNAAAEFADNSQVCCQALQLLLSVGLTLGSCAHSS